MKQHWIRYAFVMGVCVCLCGCRSDNYEVKRTHTIQDEQRVNAQTMTEPRDINGSYQRVLSFSLELFSQNLEEKNPVISPISAYIALAMAGEGADGDTRKEFEYVLGEDMQSAPLDMMHRLPRAEEKMTLQLANSVWIDDEMTEQANWRKLLENEYKAQVFRKPLEKEKTVEKMNDWVSEKTHGMIPRMVEKPFKESDRFVLFNVLYFKAQWQKKFDPTMTQKMTFTTEDGNERKVDMMRMSMEELRYVQSAGTEGVVLPYSDDNFVFMAMKPTDGKSVREMYETLSENEIAEMLMQEETTLCNVRIPKFEVEFDKVLNDSLMYMGLATAFDPIRADFGKMTEDERQIFISMVRQKAVVIVDEEGTEASAVTMVEMLDGCALIEEEPKELYFDSPFLYVIADKERKVPLFIGIIDEPDK